MTETSTNAEPMALLPVDHLLRSVPLALEPEMRLKLLSIGFAIRGIEHAYVQIKRVAYEIAASELDDSRFTLAIPLFEHAWAMIDRVHALRQLLQSMELMPGGVLEDYVSRHESASVARNHMDHLHTRIRNISRRTNQQNPVFGVVTFSYVSEAHITRQSGGEIALRGMRRFAVFSELPNITASAGNFLGRAVEIPIGAVEFEVDGSVVDLSAANADLQGVADRFNTHTRSAIDEAIRALATQQNLDADKILGERSGGQLITYLEIEFPDGPS